MVVITIHYDNFFVKNHHGLNGAIGKQLVSPLPVRTRCMSVGSNPTPGSVFCIYQSIHNNDFS